MPFVLRVSRQERGPHASSPILFASCSCSVESANLVSDSVFADSQSGVGRETCPRNAAYAKRRSNRVLLCCCFYVFQLVALVEAFGDVLVQIDVVRARQFQFVFMNTELRFISFFSNSICALEQAMHQRIVFSPHLFHASKWHIRS